MADSPTITIAKLDDKELLQSIDNLVNSVKEKSNEMANSFDSAVERMKNKFNELGNLKIDSGGSSDGGSTRRAKSNDKETDSVDKKRAAYNQLTDDLKRQEGELEQLKQKEEALLNTKQASSAPRGAQESIDLNNREGESVKKLEGDYKLLQFAKQNAVSAKATAQNDYDKEKAKLDGLLSKQRLIIDAKNEERAAWDNLNTKMKEYAATQERLLQRGSGITPNERKLIGIDQTTVELISRMRQEMSAFNLTLSDGVKYSAQPISFERFGELKKIKEQAEERLRSMMSMKTDFQGNADDVAKIDAVIAKFKEYIGVINTLYEQQQKLEKNHGWSKYSDAFNKYYISKIPLAQADFDYVGAVNYRYFQSKDSVQLDKQIAEQKGIVAQKSAALQTATANEEQADKNLATAQRLITAEQEKMAQSKSAQATASQNAAAAAGQEKTQNEQLLGVQNAIADKEAQIERTKAAMTQIEQASTSAIRENTAAKKENLTLDQQAQAKNIAANVKPVIKPELSIEDLKSQAKTLESEIATITKQYGALFAQDKQQTLNEVNNKIREMSQGTSGAVSEENKLTEATKQQNQELSKTKDIQDKINQSKAQTPKQTSELPSQQYLFSDAERLKSTKEKTIETLMQEIGILKMERIAMSEGSDELKRQNEIIEKKQSLLKSLLTSDTRKEMGAAISMPTNTIEQTATKLERLKTLSDTMREKGFFDERQLNRIDNAIASTAKKLERLKGLSPEQQVRVAITLPENTLERAKAKLEEMKKVASTFEGKGVLDEVTWNKLQSQIGRTEEQIKRLGTVSYEDARKLRIAFADAMNLPAGGVDEIQAKLQTIVNVMYNLRGQEVISPQQVANGKREIEELTNKLRVAIELQKNYNDEIKNRAQAIRESEQWKRTGTYSYDVDGVTYYVSQKQGSIEEQIVRHKEQQLNYSKELLTAGMAIENNANKQIVDEEKLDRLEKERLETIKEISNTPPPKKRYTTPEMEVDSSDVFRRMTASALGIAEKDLSEFSGTINVMTTYVNQLRNAWNNLSSSAKSSPFGKNLREEFMDASRMLSILNKELSRPVSLKVVTDLPEKTLDDISFKTQMLRSYAQGINVETVTGQQELTKVQSLIDNLNDKAKNLQKTASQIRFEKIGEMPEDTFMNVGRKLVELRRHLNDLKNQPIINEKEVKRTESLIDKLSQKFSNLGQTRGTDANIKSAINVEPKTLDEIARAMQRIQAIRQNLNIDTQRTQIEQLNNTLATLRKRQDEILNKNQQMIASNTAIGRSWNYMKNRLAFYFSVGASTQFVRSLIEVRSQYEMNERALGILIDSAERGTRIFNELSQMALVSPYTLIELSTAAKQLTAYDVAARDVVDTTRRLADMTAAVGIPIERLTYALGQIKAYGYLNARDARMFSNTGIPLVKQLAEYYTELECRMVSVADIYDRIKKKSIGYNEVMQVIQKMTDEGGKFFNFQAKMAETLKVQLANLTLAWNNMLNDIGKSEQGILSGAIGLLKEMFLQWKNINRVLGDVAITFGVVKMAQLYYLLVLRKTSTAAASTIVIGKKLTDVFGTLGSTMKQVLTSGTSWLYLLAFAAGSAVMSIVRGNEAMKEFNKSLRENSKNTYEDLDRFLKQYNSLRNSLTKEVEGTKTVRRRAAPEKSAGTVIERFENVKETVTVNVDIDEKEAVKAWEAIRERIELSTHASDEYITRLMAIENISERLRQGFSLLENMQAVSAALKNLGDDDIELKKDWSDWWNLDLLPDGTIENLEEVQSSLNKINKEYDSLENALEIAKNSWTYEGDTAVDYVNDYRDNLTQFREDLKLTTDSVMQFIKSMGWSKDADKINEVFKQVTDNLISQNMLDPQQAYTLQVEIEEARSRAAKEALRSRLNDLAAASHEEQNREAKTAIVEEWKKQKQIYDAWDTYNGRTKVEWERFTKWLKEQHISETTAMFRNMEAKDIASLNFMEGKHSEWVKKMVTQYAKEHKMSYDEAFDYLKSWVQSANTWSVTIPVMLNVQEQSDFQKEFSKRVREKYGETALERFAKVSPNQNEDLATYTDNAWKNLKKLREDEKKYNRDNTEWGKKKKQETADEIKLQEQALKLFNQRLEKETKGNKKDKVLEALKMEIDLVKKLQSDYDKLTKSGANSAEALMVVRNAYGKTINLINAKMGAIGLPKLDMSIITGKDPNKVLAFFDKVKDTLSMKGLSNVERMKAVEGIIQEFTVSAKTYNLDKITKGLNNELGRLKDEYELAVSLDADPEMGNLFAEMMGLDMNSLPRTVEEYADRYSKILNRYLKDKGSDLQFTGDELYGLTKFDMAAFQEQYEAGTFNEEWLNAIKKAYEDISSKRKKEIEDSVKGWQSLVQKYAEYEHKISEVTKKANQERLSLIKQFGDKDERSQAVRLVAEIEQTEDPTKKQELVNQLKVLVDSVVNDDETKIKLKVAIDNQEAQESARIAFEEYQKSPEWVIATGDLANMSKKAINTLINELEAYKKSAKNLSPKQIKQINSALKSLYKEQRQGNPFGYIKNMLDRAKDKADEFNEEIEKTQKEIDKLSAKNKQNILEGITDDKTRGALKDAIKKLDELKKKQKEAGEVDASAWVGAINETAGAVQGAVGLFNDLAKAVSGVDKTVVDDVFSVIGSAGSAAATGAMIGGSTGAIAGAILGAVTGIAKVFGASDSINSEIEKSLLEVKKLENAYKNLEVAIEDAYGVAKIGYRQATIANKELQLAELQRQLALEQSRTGKERDNGRIEELKGQIIDLKNEIKRSSEEIAADLLGISSVGSTAEQLMGEYIDALRRGEDASKAFTGSYKEMIANMIKQLYVTKVIGPQLEGIMDSLNDRIEKRTKREAAAYEDALRMKTTADEMKHLNGSDPLQRSWYNKEEDRYETSYYYWYSAGFFDDYIYKMAKYFDMSADSIAHLSRDAFNELWDRYIKDAEKNYKDTSRSLKNASIVTIDDMDMVAEDAADILPLLKASEESINSLLERYDLFIDDSTDKKLSALQQGIQGITEDTAGALEAYMNSVSQQVYYHSTLLEEILSAVLQIGGIDTLNPEVMERVEAARQANAASLPQQTGDTVSFVQQIRDIVSGFPLEEQTGIQAQMLLQLQQSYQVQASIHSLLDGWNNASGQAVRVELVS